MNGELAEKEFSLIQEIARNPDRTQRDLSESVGLSLGMTNLLLRRLARKGLIKVTQLDWKRTQYLLTFKGALEKTRKAYGYTLYTLRIFRQLRENIATALKSEYAAGRREFWLVAQDEILDLLKDTARELGLAGARFCFHQRFADVPPQADLVLAATLEPRPKTNGRRVLTVVDFNNINFRIR